MLLGYERWGGNTGKQRCSDAWRRANCKAAAHKRNPLMHTQQPKLAIRVAIHTLLLGSKIKAIAVVFYYQVYLLAAALQDHTHLPSVCVLADRARSAGFRASPHTGRTAAGVYRGRKCLSQPRWNDRPSPAARYAAATGWRCLRLRQTDRRCLRSGLPRPARDIQPAEAHNGTCAAAVLLPVAKIWIVGGLKICWQCSYRSIASTYAASPLPHSGAHTRTSYSEEQKY